MNQTNEDLNIQVKKEIDEIVEDMNLFDNTLLRMVFNQNKEAVGLVLSILLERNDLEIIDVQIEKFFSSPKVDGKCVRLDILAKDKEGKYYNIEIHNGPFKNLLKRARYYSSMTDVNLLKAGKDYNDLCDTYIIFILNKDYFEEGLPIYKQEKYLTGKKEPIQDGSFIMYVNGEWQENDPIGRLMKDFNAKDPKTMHYPLLAKGVGYFKNDKEGKAQMSIAAEKRLEELAEKLADQRAEKLAVQIAETRIEKLAEKITEEKDKQTACNLYQNGASIDLIAKSLSYPQEKIQSWIDEMKMN
jgi:predicted transposase/invertase (TIGR01784 family)